MPRLLCFLTLVAALGVPPVTVAQPPPTMPAPAPMPGMANDDTTFTRGTTADLAEPSGPERPVFAYFLALVGSAGALLIVCTPSRKKS